MLLKKISSYFESCGNTVSTYYIFTRNSRYFCRSFVVFLIVFFVSADYARAGCHPDLAAADPLHCKYFVEYKPPGSHAVDDRILSRLGATDGAKVRSYALVIGISSYPNFQEEKDRTLPPAKADIANLIAFFREQGFDEIILLEDKDASKDNINYFLDVYLNQHLDIFGATSRVVIAHSGHGGPSTSAELPGNIILSEADGAQDYAHMYSLGDLAPRLRNLASKSFHLAALMGSCYSGGIFSSQRPGGSNDWYPKARGAHAVSSTPHNDLAYGLGAQHGSIFFDSLIQGTRSGLGDPLSAGWVVGEDGDLHRIGGGIVRLGSLTSYVSDSIDQLGINPATRKPFPQILIGPLTSSDRNGAFFFLGSPKEKKVQVARNGFSASLSTADTGSALLNNSGVKIFSAPDSYQIAGIDVSHYNEVIDWGRVAKAGYQFAFMKATESVSLVDQRFAANWSGAKEFGVKRGAYHVFDFCLSVDQQMQNIRKAVPRDAAALPIALDLSWHDGPSNPRQKQCGAIDPTRQNVHKLLSQIEAYYGKAPIIFANQSGVNDLIDASFLHYPLWLQFYGDDRTALSNLGIKGQNPWTFWQHSAKGRVPGIDGNVDLDVFFGNQETLTAILGGAGNIALTAAGTRPR